MPIISRLHSVHLVCLALAMPILSADEGFSLVDAGDNEINVEVMPAEGTLLSVWFLDHEEDRPAFETMLKAVNQAGIEVWRIDMLADYFLARSNENVRTLSGEGVRAVIEAAHGRSQKQLLLVAYDRMPVPLLRGVRRWQHSGPTDSRLVGAVLFYPNLYGPPPLAGHDPQLDPIVGSTNIPVTIYQPQQGAHRWRLGEVMDAFWNAGSPALVYMAPDIRDWFFMHPPGRDPAETPATAAVPDNLKKLAALMGGFPKPMGPTEKKEHELGSAVVQGLVPFEPRKAPLLELSSFDGTAADYREKVTLVNFWATWCPPCVEEIPSLNRLIKAYEGRDFAVVSVDYRESVETIAEFVVHVPVNFPVLLDLDGKVSRNWKVFSFPSSFLLDKAGRIRYSVNRAIDWNSLEIYQAVDTLLREDGE